MKITTDIPLSKSQINLTLKAALVANGLVNSSHRNISVSNLNGSIYHWEYDQIPNDFRGSVVFYTGTITGNDLSEVVVKSSLPIEANIISTGASGSTEVLP